MIIQHQTNMNKIVRKEQFSEKVFLFEIEAPLIAKSRKAGNFVIVRVGKKGERMPLTIAAADIEKGTITLVVLIFLVLVLLLFLFFYYIRHLHMILFLL